MPIRHGTSIFVRDMERVLGHRPLTAVTREPATVVIQYAGADDPIKTRAEAFALRFDNNPDHGEARMILSGSDDLGIVYGLLYISHKFLELSLFGFGPIKK